LWKPNERVATKRHFDVECRPGCNAHGGYDLVFFVEHFDGAATSAAGAPVPWQADPPMMYMRLTNKISIPV